MGIKLRDGDEQCTIPGANMIKLNIDDAIFAAKRKVWFNPKVILD